ncbi:DUF4013 domain-containing protein [Opitutales bacterium]|uniref:DUF4013 domain-containing protein n=1 Tax=Candidatus Chordibacter forsetii TaxID=3381758 RepID=UPI0023268C33|nr:DUF4013 domain-containing protein [Opitutales bacterium]MDA8807165.1 DUF4013 domain-containing protein [Opitutales bacterium]
MPSLEAVCTRLFGRPGWIPKVLLGGGLSFIPGLNLFALGYLFIYGRQLRRSGRVDLPEWSEMNWPELFVCGLRLFGLLILYIGLPMLVGWIVSILLYFLTFGLLGVVAYFPLAICGFFSPMFFLSAFMAYLKHEEFRDAFQIRILLQEVLSGWKPLALPVVAFWGIFLLAIPLYGLSFFIGAWILIAYSSALRMKNFS